MNEDRGLVEQQIEDWFRRNVAFPDKDLHGHCKKVTLRHLAADKKPQGDVRSFAVNFDEGAEEDYHPLLHQIVDAAQQDADDINQGVQTYAIYAFYAKDRNHYPRKIFRVSPSDVELTHDVSPTEKPNAEGLVAQSMRHLEAVMRTASITMGYHTQAQQREIMRLAQQNESFAKQQLDMMILVQDMLDNSHGRRLEEKKAEADVATRELIISKLDALVPVIINRLAGQTVVPQPNDTSFMMMASLLENLTEDQQMTILNSLNDVQKITLAEIMAAYEKKKEGYLTEQRKKMAKILPSNSAPRPPGSSAPTSPHPGDDHSLPSLPEVIGIADRTKQVRDDSQSSDPKIVALEADGQLFSERLKKFRDFLDNSANPSTGDKKTP